MKYYVTKLSNMKPMVSGSCLGPAIIPKCLYKCKVKNFGGGRGRKLNRINTNLTKSNIIQRREISRGAVEKTMKSQGVGVGQGSFLCDKSARDFPNFYLADILLYSILWDNCPFFTTISLAKRGFRGPHDFVVVGN